MELTSVNFLLESESQLTTQHNKAVSQLTTTTDQLGECKEVVIVIVIIIVVVVIVVRFI